MSFLKTVRLSDFRNYEAADLHDLGRGFVVLYGSNGAGKTNILDAIHYLSQTKSYFNHINTNIFLC